MECNAKLPAVGTYRRNCSHPRCICTDALLCASAYAVPGALCGGSHSCSLAMDKVAKFLPNAAPEMSCSRQARLLVHHYASHHQASGNSQAASPCYANRAAILSASDCHLVSSLAAWSQLLAWADSGRPRAPTSVRTTACTSTTLTQ